MALYTAKTRNTWSFLVNRSTESIGQSSYTMQQCCSTNQTEPSEHNYTTAAPR